MQPKAVLSFVGRVVGVAVLVASPLIARAAEPASDHHAKDHARARSSSSKKVRGHAHKTEDKAETKASAKVDAKKRVGPDAAHDGEPSPEVQIERASTKHAPHASATPLPTIAAASTKPLAIPASDCKGAEKVDMRHAVEPARTPIIMTSPIHAASKKKGKPPCLHSAIEVTRGGESEAFALTKCDGTAAPLAVEEMSILTRPGSAAKPTADLTDLAKKTGEEIAPGIKRIDARLLERLQLVVDHFAKDGKKAQMFVVSGYRPTSKGSFHATGRAIDFRMEGVENTDLVTFCKTLPDTGCGFYPNSSFIHLDVRDQGAGHVAWIDASTPGEKPAYVAAWPPPPKSDEDTDAVHMLARLDELQLLPPTPATELKDDDREDVKPPQKPAVMKKTEKTERRDDEEP
jgi:hypothetical protein